MIERGKTGKQDLHLKCHATERSIYYRKPVLHLLKHMQYRFAVIYGPPFTYLGPLSEFAHISALQSLELPVKSVQTKIKIMTSERLIYISEFIYKEPHGEIFRICLLFSQFQLYFMSKKYCSILYSNLLSNGSLLLGLTILWSFEKKFYDSNTFLTLTSGLLLRDLCVETP